MIKAMYVLKDSFLRCYAVDLLEAIEIFQDNGILHGYAKQVGTDKYTAF